MLNRNPATGPACRWPGVKGVSFTFCRRLQQVIDRSSLRVTINNDDVHLTAKELAILELFLRKPGTNVVGVYIGRLRKIIDRKDDDEID